MLKDSHGCKEKIISLHEQTWRDLMEEILDTIKKRIAVLNRMIDHNLDEYICAGLYTFVIEEFGKLIILTKCPRRSNDTERSQICW